MKWTQVNCSDLTTGDIVLVDLPETTRLNEVIHDCVSSGIGVTMPIWRGKPRYIAKILAQGDHNVIATTKDLWVKIVKELNREPGLVRRIKACLV